MKRFYSLLPILLALAAPGFATVTLVSPANNSTVGSPVSFVATSSTTCAQGVAAMGLYVNNTLDYVVNADGLNTSIALSPGTYNTVVEEWDNCGGATTAPAVITVSNSAGVSVSSPINGSTVASPVTFAATATTGCAKGISAMGVYVNNELKYTANASSINVPISLGAGTYNTVVEEWDNCGGAATKPVTITVGSGHTGVSVTSPLNGSTVASPVTYAATATTACASGVAAMGVYVDNVLKYTANASSINVPITIGAGTHSSVVEEWDNCGGAATTPVAITVGSSHTGVSVTSPVNGSTVASPVTFAATATTSCANGISAMGVYVDNVLKYTANASSIDVPIPVGTGTHNTVVEEWDGCGGAATTPVAITVGGNTGVSVTLPSNGSTVASPVSFAASATSTCAKGVGSMGVYVDGQLKYSSNGSTLNTSIPLSPGTYNAAVQEWDNCGGAVNTPVTFTVGTATAGNVNIPTWHVDNNRSGWNAAEQSLAPSNVAPETFGKLFSLPLDGYEYGEPLLVSNIAIDGAQHNVLYAATESDSVYAFDADSYGTGAPLWRTSLLNSGETPVETAVIKPYQGVTSTPVIDPTTNTIYVVSEVMQTNGASVFRLNALDITTGAQKFGGPVNINASVAGTNSESVNGVVSLKTSCIQRAALLLANGTVYIGFGGCKSGWLLAYNAATLAQTGVFNSSPNLNGEGPYASAGGVWMGSGGPAADSAGNIYVVTGNGPWDGKTAFSDSVLKFNSKLQLLDYFTPQDYAYMNCNDADLAAGGLLLIPGSSEAVVGGKTGKLYLVNTNNLGKEQANDAGATQSLYLLSGIESPYAQSCTDSSGTHTTDINSYEIFGTSTYFNGSVYNGLTPTVANAPAGLRQFTYSGTLSPAEYSVPGVQEKSLGTTPFVSSNGSSNGIVWMVDHGIPLQATGSTPTSAILRAYDANNLQDELYDSTQNSGDAPGYGIKFTSPVVANGKVYFATGHDPVSVANPQGEIDVYGLK